jgi:hypothetical protein
MRVLSGMRPGYSSALACFLPQAEENFYIHAESMIISSASSTPYAQRAAQPGFAGVLFGQYPIFEN